MSYYLYQLTYSADAVKAMMAKPSDRKAAATKLIESVGGKLHHIFFAFGTSDVICLVEAPDDKTMVAIAAAVGSSGTVSAASTTKLISMEDAMAGLALAAKAAGAYRSPMA
jgi:uncharacterized protein with GYD domain